MSDTITTNFINGEFKPSAAGGVLDVFSPSTGAVCNRVTVSTAEDVAEAVAAAEAAFPAWSTATVKRRAAIMFKFHELLDAAQDELTEIIITENGKNRAEAIASIAKGNETVEWACSLPQLVQGRTLEVSRGITCHDVREPIGIVASICPFNFPVMVPMWTVPIALAAGNCVILKPSEKVPGAAAVLARLLAQAGVPKGVFQVVNGTVDVVNALCDHPAIAAVTFVGSSRVAEIVSKRCRANNKRVLALGGAKNHLVSLPDCDVTMAAHDIVASFSGCCGQRCMAASVLLLVGEQPDLIAKIVDKAATLLPGTEPGQVGPIIDPAAKARVISYIERSVANGATVLLDGRAWADKAPGNWIGPTVLVHKSKDDDAMKDEIFGPVLSVYVVGGWEEAIAIENSNPYGNAASIYTSSGGNAEWFTARFRAGMIGVNIGIPVPREPFSFGGLYPSLSKYGDLDITGEGALDLFTRRRKVTTKWGKPTGPGTPGATATSTAAAAAAASTDKASFVGRM